MTEAILKRLNAGRNEQGAQLKVSGYSWLDPDTVVSLPPSALGSRVLCRRHNSALSGLDHQATRLFDALDSLDAGKGTRLFLFSGADIERWLLKVLCGHASTGCNLFPHHDCDCTVPDRWVQIVFGAADFEPGQGLYVSRTRGEAVGGPRDAAFSPIGWRGRLAGATVSLVGVTFVLLMHTEHPQRREYFGRSYVHRPLELWFYNAHSGTSIMLSWPGSADLGTIQYRLQEA